MKDKVVAPVAPAETVLVIGAGMSGLALALALRDSDKQVVLIERDSEPPELEPLAAFEGWKRPGVSQFRYSHVFVGRLQSLLRTRYPELFRELLAAGMRTSAFEEGLPPALRKRYVPQPGDEQMISLCGRRATFEYVVRRYVGKLPNVRFVHGAVAQGLMSEKSGDALRITGVEIKRGATREVLRGDVVVDAAGRNSPVQGWLQALGGKIEVREQPSDFGYFCRHYRIRPGEQEPEHIDVAADLDYLKYAIFFGEAGEFAVAFGFGEQEQDLTEVVRRADAFDELCRQFPNLARWVERAGPVSKVLGAAKIVNRWARIADSPRVSGLFLTGDAGFEANPIDGRGYAAAFVQSHLLADALLQERDHARRSSKLEASLRAELRPYHRASIVADQVFHDRADRARGKPPSLSQRLNLYAYEHVMMPALATDMTVVREILNVGGMGTPATPLRILRFALRVIAVWLRRPFSAPFILPKGPDRGELLQRATRVLKAGSPNEPQAVTLETAAEDG